MNKYKLVYFAYDKHKAVILFEDDTLLTVTLIFLGFEKVCPLLGPVTAIPIMMHV